MPRCARRRRAWTRAGCWSSRSAKRFPERSRSYRRLPPNPWCCCTMSRRSIPTTPVLFLNTHKLFGETMRYRDRVQETLGLTDIRSVGPASRRPPGPGSRRDAVEPRSGRVLPLPQGCAASAGRWRLRCGRHRPQALPDRGAGRPWKRSSSSRGGSASIRWSIGALPELIAYIDEHRLPKHPLINDGYPSIGCIPCTRRVAAGEGYRDGRWAGTDKVECGIHTGVDGEGI